MKYNNDYMLISKELLTDTVIEYCGNFAFDKTWEEQGFVELDIYIGRLPNNEYNKWAYPKELRNSFPDGTPRQDIIAAYEEYFLSSDIKKDIHELKYKTLGCWCKK
jgi:hypothetical protein